MAPEQLTRFTHLVEFLGMTLGPDYEIVLHEIDRPTPCVVAIANGQISGRTVGAPLTNVALDIIANKAYVEENWKMNYRGVSASGRLLRCSTFFIKNEQNELVGLLCINFDDSRFRALSSSVYSLCHPDNYVNDQPSFFSFKEIPKTILGQNNSQQPSLASNVEIIRNIELPVSNSAKQNMETFHNSIEDTAKAALNDAMPKNVDATKLSQKEKIRIIEQLDEKGIFLLKGTIPLVASTLKCSQATIYLYLSKIRSKNN